MFPFCITGHLLDTTALNTYPFILRILFSTYMMYKGCHSGSKQAFAFHFQFLCSSGPSVVCTVGAVEQLLALRFVLGINFDFRLETESLGSPCICEGPLYHFPLPRYFTSGNHSERGEVKVLTTLPIKVWVFLQKQVESQQLWDLELSQHVVEKPEGECSAVTAVNYLHFNRWKGPYLHFWGQM